jgi:hypothetical protein
MIKLKTILQEKKDLDNKHIDQLEKLTDRNEHTAARRYLADLIGHKKLVEMYDHIDKLHYYFRDMNDLRDARDRLDKELFDKANRMFGNFKDAYNRGF